MKLEKYIITKAEDKSKLLEATQALANLYVESKFTDEIKVSKVPSERDLYIITFPNQPDFERFKYFVNYLHYPESGEFGTTTKGYWTITEEEEDIIPKQFVGSRAMLYVSENDTEYVNVFCAFDSTFDNYKLGFGSGEELVKLMGTELSFFEKRIDFESIELIETVVPVQSLIEKRNKPKRERIGCLMALPVLIALFVIGALYVL
jgi:hypothetical protein